MTAKLTPAGKAMLAQIGAGKHSFFDNGIVPDSGIWMAELTAESKAAKTAKGNANVARKLVEDGYFTSSDTDEDNPLIELTELGAKTALELAYPLIELPVESGPEVEATPEGTAPWNKPNKETAKQRRLRIEAEAKEAIAQDLLGTTPEVEATPEVEEAPLEEKAAKAVKTPKKSPTGDKAPAKKPAPAPRVKAEPTDPKVVPADVKVKSVAKGSLLKWRNKARETKTVVGIYDGAASAEAVAKATDSEPQRWILHCEAHDEVSRFTTYKQAWLDSAHPMSFCTSCSVL